MPVGAIIGGVASIAGGLLGGNAQSDAIEDASDAQARASREAIGLQRDIYNQNVGFQTPYLNTGNAAMGQINALLGLQVPQSNTPPPQLPGTGSQTGSGQGGQGLWGGLMGRAWEQRIANGFPIEDAPPWIQARFANQPGGSQTGPMPPHTPPISQPTAQSAYDQFKNYTGYTSRLAEGQNALNAGWAGRGTLQSGAAGLAFQRQGQDYASNEFGKYMGYLGGQQQLGPGAANALGGVGTNYANAAGQIGMQQGNNLANAAIAQGNVTSNMWGNIAGGIGGIAGSMFGGSSYSDRRLKTKIKLLRRDEDGLGWYEFAYSQSPDLMLEGVMADEVKALRPKAYSEDARGYGMVNYAELAA
jgi:hypothetical protein